MPYRTKPVGVEVNAFAVRTSPVLAGSSERTPPSRFVRFSVQALPKPDSPAQNVKSLLSSGEGCKCCQNVAFHRNW